MSVDVEFVGSLGCRLFQYAMGRIVADGLGLALECRPAKETSGQLELVGWQDCECWPDFVDASLHRTGRFMAEPQERHGFAKLSSCMGQVVDLSAILSDPTPRSIHFRGYYQRVEYFEPVRNRLREWFALRTPRASIDIGRDDVVIAVRRDPIAGLHGWTLPLSYYLEILDHLRNVGKVYVCGTEGNLSGGLRNRLRCRRAEYFDGTAAERFDFIKRFRRVIMGNSPLAWWAAFLGGGDEMYGPASLDGRTYAFSGYKSVHLAIPDEQYHAVPIRETCSWHPLVASNDPHAVVLELGGRIFVTPAGRCTVQVHAFNVPPAAVAWLLRLSEAVPITVIQEKFPTADVIGLVQRLLQMRLLRVINHFVDPP